MSNAHSHRRRRAARRLVRPGDLEPFEIALLEPVVGRRLHALLTVQLRQTDPHQLLVAALDDDPAHLVEKLLLGDGLHHRLVAEAQRGQVAVGRLESALRGLALGDVHEGGAHLCQGIAISGNRRCRQQHLDCLPVLAQHGQLPVVALAARTQLGQDRGPRIPLILSAAKHVRPAEALEALAGIPEHACEGLVVL